MIEMFILHVLKNGIIAISISLKEEKIKNTLNKKKKKAISIHIMYDNTSGSDIHVTSNTHHAYTC